MIADMSFDADYHRRFMAVALELAAEAAASDEVPVGAVVVCGDEVVGRGANRTLDDTDPTAHAEVVALRAAARELGRARLDGCRLYVTLEPCPMCAGAIVLARLDALFFGAHDAKGGATGTLYSITEDRRLNHRVPTIGGLLDDESIALLRQYFQGKRGQSSD